MGAIKFKVQRLPREAYVFCDCWPREQRRYEGVGYTDLGYLQLLDIETGAFVIQHCTDVEPLTEAAKRMQTDAAIWCWFGNG